jgi:UDP-N-acetyl-D-galactosamine dehydrogenase
MIDSGRKINDAMGTYVAGQIVKKIIAQGKNIRDAQILIMGVTFKENVSDIRNSKVADIYQELVDFGARVEVTDPLADYKDVKKEYGFDLTKDPQGKYDAIVLAVGHQEYRGLDESYFSKLSSEKGFVADVKGFLREELLGSKKLGYWSL